MTSRESRVQCPESRVKRPESRVQSPESSVQSHESGGRVLKLSNGQDPEPESKVKTYETIGEGAREEGSSARGLPQVRNEAAGQRLRAFGQDIQPLEAVLFDVLDIECDIEQRFHL